MTDFKRYILNEIKVIEKDTKEKGISPTEWVERYADEYHRKFWDVGAKTRFTAPHY